MIGSKVLIKRDDDTPLDNPKILNRVLNSLNPDYFELQNIRQVSRLWNEMTLDIWRKTATLKLIPDTPETPELCSSSTLSSPIYQRREQSGCPMSEFLINLVDPSDHLDLDYKPFHRVKLKGIDIESEMEFPGPNSDIINVFPRIWDLIGNHVKYLHCDECTFENTLRMGAFQKLVLEKSPILEQLVMTNTTLLSPSWEQNANLMISYRYHLKLKILHIYGDFPMGIANILPFVPKLEELKVRNGMYTSICEMEKHDFSNVFLPFTNPTIIKNENLKIKKLDVIHTDTFKINFNPTTELRSAALPLEELSLEIAPMLESENPENPATTPPAYASTSRDWDTLRSTEDVLAPIIREHLKTLKMLEVYRPPFAECYDNFPFRITLAHVKELRLWGNVSNNLKFLKYLPNLKKLYINTHCFEKWVEMKDCFNHDFPYEFQPFLEDIVKNTGSFYNLPSIKMEFMRELHLEFQLQADSIVQLATWMPSLKIFRSVLDKITFRVVCSTMPYLKELGILFGSEVDNDTITGISPGIPRDSYNITSFQELKRFTMDCYCGKSMLKDSAVYLGFMKMHLFKLEVCVSKQMSERAEEELKAQIPVFRFIRNYGPEPHEGYDCCRRSKYVREVIKRHPVPSPHQSATDRVFYM